jgi:hypothetical protein
MKWSVSIAARLLSLALLLCPAGAFARPQGDLGSGVAADPAQSTATPGVASPSTAPAAGPVQPPAPGSPAPQPPATSPGTPGRPTPTLPTFPPPVLAPATTQPPTLPAGVSDPSATESARAAFARQLDAEFDSPTLSAQPGTFGSVSGFSSGGVPQMIGDMSPLATRSTLPTPFPPPSPPNVPLGRRAAAILPSVRAVKFSEDQSPRPQDRVYYTFNYFQGADDQINSRLQAPVGYTQIFRDILGLEKTFLDGQGSVGIRMPIDSITAMSALPRQEGNAGGSSSAVGDISIFSKYILLQNRQTGSLLSACFAVTPPTGPGRFAGLNSLGSTMQTTNFQPCLGYILNLDRVYLQGFSIVDVPANSQNPVLMYNDFGIGYFLRKPEANSSINPMISMIAPTFEVHVSTPLNHRDVYNPRDPGGSIDIVNLTYGINIGIYDRTLLTFAIANPVSSPKPFDFETMFFVNFFYGRSLIRPTTTPPVLGN